MHVQRTTQPRRVHPAGGTEVRIAETGTAEARTRESSAAAGTERRGIAEVRALDVRNSPIGGHRRR